MPRVAYLLIGCLLVFTHLAVAAENQDSQAQKLVGWWKEYSPSSNIVSFAPDGKLKLLLKKGEVGDLHSLDGTWSIAGDSTLHIVFTANGRDVARDVNLSFNGEEMILTDEEGVQTKHRRYSGSIPSEYSW